MPAYNEEATIGKTLERITECLGECMVIVVDDGSSDRTAIIARQHGAAVVELQTNRGIGKAVQTGFAVAESAGKEYVVQIDADGQHDPKYIRQMMSVCIAEQANVVIGSRFLSQSPRDLPFVRKLGIVFFSKLLSILMGRRITDCSSGLRLIDSNARTLFLSAYPSDFPDADALLYLGMRGMRITETPIVSAVREGGQSSLRSIRLALYPIKMTVSIFATYARERGSSTDTST